MTKVRDYLGPYRLVRLIRLGSTCQVWEAVREQDGERFALKVLRPDLRSKRGELAQLKHEWEVGQTLNHPRIIRMHEFNTTASTPFLVLELFSELNLKLALRKGTEALAFYVQNIAEQSAESLYYLHEKGWVHCDVKPDNFLFGRDGTIKLIDFTIAQRSLKKSFLQRIGLKTTVQGTRSYMAPEQIRAQALDARADIYSFGCVLYEVLAGKLPYTGTSSADLLNKHLLSPIPSVLVANDQVTNEFAELLKRMMAKKKEDRPSSMWEFLKVLRAMKIFKKAPRMPSTWVFDEIPQVGPEMRR